MVRLNDPPLCVNILCHRLRSVTVWLMGHRQILQQDVLRRFKLTTHCLLLQTMCSAQVWGCSRLGVIAVNAVVATVDIIGGRHALSRLPQYCQSCPLSHYWHKHRTFAHDNHQVSSYQSQLRKHHHRQNVTSHHSFSLLWQFSLLLSLDIPYH